MRPVAGHATLFVVAALTTDAALAEKMDSSAGNFLPRCRAVVDHEYDKLFDIGICSGVMVAIHDTSMLLNAPANSQVRACMPDSITVEESIAGVVHWLDRHPQRWHENFTSLAMSALHDAWRCDV